MKSALYVVLFLTLILHYSGCSTSNEIAGESGGVTETIGIVVSAEGVPVADVNIEFIPTGHIPQQDSGQFTNRTSNELGEFFFAGIPDGAYNLMYNKGGDVAFRESLSVVGGKPEFAIVDTLLPFGSVSGVVQLHEKHNSGNVFILLRGTNRFCIPLDSTGRFIVDSLAEGEYPVTFIADYDYYAQYDTMLMVISGLHDTLTDTIKLEYLGIETPTLSSIEYDSSLLRVTLRWNTAESASLAGYQVFRKVNHPDSLAVSVAYMVQDTFFIDSCNNSTVLEGKKYLYQVSCINQEQMSGKLSDMASIVYNSLFSKRDSLLIEQTDEAEYASMVCTDAGILYLVTSNESVLHKIDINSMDYLDSYHLPDSAIPTSVSLMEDSSLLIATRKGVYNVDTTGLRLWRYSAFHTKNENGTSGQYTRYVSSFNQQYFYYTASQKNYDATNVILRFNCFSGNSDTLGVIENGEITSLYFEPASEKIYLTIKHYNRLSLEYTTLNQFFMTTLYNCSNSNSAQFCLNTDSNFSLLSNGTLLSIEGREFAVKDKAFLQDNCQAVVSLHTGERVVFCRDGNVIKIGKNK